MNGFALTAAGTAVHSFDNALTMQPDTADALQTWVLQGHTLKLRDYDLCLDSPNNSTAKLTKLQA